MSALFRSSGTKDTRSLSRRITNRIEAGTKQILLRAFARSLPVYLVNEYPRSGGTWICQMLSAALGVSFPRNRIPAFESCVLHGHYLRPEGLKNVVSVFRDGRDVLVSYYFYHYFHLLRTNLYVSHVGRRLPFRDPDNVVENLPKFIEMLLAKPIQPGFSWAEFVRVWWRRPGVVSTRYENVRANPGGELRRLVFELAGIDLQPSRIEPIVRKFSVERQTKRKPGEENRAGFIRKGVVGDWKAYFSHEARQVFDHFAGDELVALGYETDRQWADCSTATPGAINAG